MSSLGEHWENWLRPLSVLLVIAALAVLWWVGVLPDRWAASGILVIGLALPAGLLLEQALRAKQRLWRKLVIPIVIGCACVLGAWGPWTILSEGAVVAYAQLAADELVDIPPTGHSVDKYLIEVHGTPSFGEKSVKIELRFDASGHPPVFFADELSAPQLKKRAPGTKPGRSTFARAVAADLRQGGTVRVTPEKESKVVRPIEVTVREGGPALVLLLSLGLPLILVALYLDASSPMRQRSRVAALAIGALALTLGFEELYTADNLGRAMLFDLAMAAVVGVALAWIATGALRRVLQRSRARREGARAAAAPATEPPEPAADEPAPAPDG